MRRLLTFGWIRRKPEPVIEILTFGEPLTGLWCPYCLLPSVLRFPWLSRFGDGPLEPFPELPPWDVCTGCDREFAPGEVRA